MLRFAPSPTGDMHIGNLRAAILNHIVSRQRAEKLLIRIEDTDTERNIPGKDAEILEILNAFGIRYDYLQYQSENIKYHHQMATTLLVQKKAFACFCDEATLEAKREAAIAKNEPYRYDGTCESLSDEEVLNNEKPFVIRIKKPDAPITFTDSIKGTFTQQPKEVDSFILLRKDKSPTYNFACAIDDMLSDISLVIRGEDHLSNTPKQIHVRSSLGYDKVVEYVHLPIILGDEGKKMSKRDNSSSIKWMLEQGFLPNAIANYLVLLGNKTPKEVFTLDEAVAFFEIKNLSNSPAKFDMSKLRFINREHIKLMEPRLLSSFFGFSDPNIGMLAKLYTEEASTIVEIEPKIKAIFAPKSLEGEFSAELLLLKNTIKAMPHHEGYDAFKDEVSIQSGLKGKSLFKPLRYLLTGALDGPNLSDVYPLVKSYLGEIIK